jgi:hypothetical protein
MYKNPLPPLKLSAPFLEAVRVFADTQHEPVVALLDTLLAQPEISDDEFVVALNLYFKHVVPSAEVLALLPDAADAMLVNRASATGGRRFVGYEGLLHTSGSEREAHRISELRSLPSQQDRRRILSALKNAASRAVPAHAQALDVRL